MVVGVGVWVDVVEIGRGFETVVAVVVVLATVDVGIAVVENVVVGCVVVVTVVIGGGVAKVTGKAVVMIRSVTVDCREPVLIWLILSQ